MHTLCPNCERQYANRGQLFISNYNRLLKSGGRLMLRKGALVECGPDFFCSTLGDQIHHSHSLFMMQRLCSSYCSVLTIMQSSDQPYRYHSRRGESTSGRPTAAKRAPSPHSHSTRFLSLSCQNNFPNATPDVHGTLIPAPDVVCRESKNS